MFGTKEVWTDKVIVLNENGWKLDNVIYNRDKSGLKDIKSVLSNFINKYYKSVK